MPQTALTDQSLVGVTNAGAQFAPAVAALPGSAYVIVWLDSARGAVYGQRYDSGGQRVGGEFQVSSPGPSPLFPSVAALEGGGFVVAWQNSSFSAADIHALRYDSAGSPVGTEFTVNSNLPNEQLDVRVIGLDGGGFLFTWDTIVADQFQEVSGRLYNSAGDPLGPDFTINTNMADAQGISSIAPLAGGGFVATWQSLTPAASGHTLLIGQRFAPGGAKIGGEFQVNTATANNPVGNDVARLSDGGFVVSWVDPAPGNGGGRVVARHYDSNGNAIGGEIVIAGKASGGFSNTAVTALADGGYVVSWTDHDAADNNVSARAMGANDAPLGDAFDVSSGAPFSSVLYPDGAVTLANGHVVFTWDGPSTNTSEDVYFRMYEFTASASPPPVNGGPGPDVLDGTSGDDTLNGLGGDDQLNGMDGNDLLNGGPGDDNLAGGAGNDIYFIDSAGDVVVENSGGGSDLVYTEVGYTLGADVERLGVNGFTTNYDINLTGNGLDNEIWGNDGRNVLDGGAGADILRGFAGDDIYIVDNVGDVVVDTTGLDTIYTSVSHRLDDRIERLGVNGFTTTYAIDLTGNDLDNEIWGNDGRNILDGGVGADILHGFGGDDIYFVDNVGDLVIDSTGFDLIYTKVSYTLGSNVERLGVNGFTTTYAINLTGNELANELWGNDGVNVLDGGAGADILHGNGGADTFAFTTALGGGNVDQLVDFQPGSDKIALDDAVFGGLAAGALNPAAFRIGAGAQDADDRIVYDSATGALYFDADGNGAGAAVQFATLHEGLALSASDFTVI